MTELMTLLSLIPEIQQVILFWGPVGTRKDPITERELRPIVAVVDWGKQRRMWRHLEERLQTE